MHMATTTRRWRRADLERLPNDGNRYEVLDGELFVTPQAAFRHQQVAARLIRKLGDYCEHHGIGEVVGPGSVIFERESELQPDVQVIPGRRAPHANVAWEDLPLPILVVELLSDSTARRDLGKKREAYLRIGIPAYWVVDLQQPRVLVWSSVSIEPTIVTDVLRWQPLDAVSALETTIEVLLGRR